MIRATFKLLLIVLWIAVCYLPVLILHLFRKRAARDRLVRFFCRWTLRILQIDLTVSGELDARRPLLLVSNHVSYLDILLLAAAFTVRFTPKAEIASWPVIGHFCRLLDCMFVDRRGGRVKEMSGKLRQTLEKGVPVSLFPESTTGNGMRLLPFKSTFFSVAEDPDIVVQPVAITYTHVGNLPIDSTLWPRLAWYGDMYLAPHAWEFLKLSGIRARMELLPAIPNDERKIMAAHCHHVIKQAIETMHRQSIQYRRKSRLSILSRSKS